MNLNIPKIKYYLLNCSIFLFIYAPRIIFTIPINMSVVILLSYIILNFKYFIKSINIEPSLIFFWFFLALYNFIISQFYGHDYTFFSKIAISVPFYIIFGSILFYVSNKLSFFDFKDRFVFLLRLILNTVIFNSIIILVEFSFPQVKSIIESFLYNDFNNIDIIHYADHPFILRGLSSAAGAGQSFYSSLGVLILIYFYLIGYFRLGKTFLIFILIFIAQIFLGRIGLIFSIAFFSIFLIKLSFDFLIENILHKIKIIFQVSIIIFSIYISLKYVDFNADVLKWSFDWFDINDGIIENSSSKELTNNYFFLPNETLHLIFGIGYFDGVSSMYNRSDVGYVKTIFSCGILLSSILYFLVFSKLIYFSAKISNSKIFFYLLIISFLLAEFKEPFLYQNFGGRALFFIIGFMGAYVKESFKNNSNKNILLLKNV